MWKTAFKKFKGVWSALGRTYPFKYFKGCLPQFLLGPFLNTLSQQILSFSPTFLIFEWMFHIRAFNMRCWQELRCFHAAFFCTLFGWWFIWTFFTLNLGFWHNLLILFMQRQQNLKKIHNTFPGSLFSYTLSINRAYNSCNFGVRVSLNNCI